MNGIRLVGCFVAGLVCGVSVVWFAVPAKKLPAVHRAPVERKTAKAFIVEREGLRREVATDEERKLRARIAEIEGALQTAQSVLKAAETNGSALAKKPLSYDEWFALQRTANPERYVMLTNNIIRSGSRLATSYMARAEALDTVDASSFDAEDAACHAEYRDALAKFSDLQREELARRCLSPDFKADSSPEWQAQMREAGRRMRELETRERFLLLGEAGRLRGLNAKDARELAETMHLIIETTSGEKRLLKFQREGGQQ